MKEKRPEPRRKGTPRRAHLLGLALQNDDGHRRITRGEKFTLLGGTQTTHEAMTESVIKTSEDLKRKGHTLETADPHEVAELLQKHFPKT